MGTSPDQRQAGSKDDLEGLHTPDLMTVDSQPRGRKRPAPRGSGAYARKRAVTACQVCRARRTKCDNKKPACSFCEKTGAKCVTEPPDYSTFDPASLRILERLDRIENLLESQSQPQNKSDISTRSHNDTNDHSDITHQDSEVRQAFRHLQIISSEVLGWSVFGNRFSLQANAITVLRRKPPKPIQPSSSALESFLGNTVESNKLISNFVEHVHIKNPILELANLKRMVQHTCLEGVGWDPESCLVLLVWALGAISTPFQQPPQPCGQESLELGAALFSAATKRLGIVFAESGILSAQCFFYAGVYLMSMLQPVSAWRHFLQALAYCQEFDFAIHASQNPQTLMSPPETSPTEQRLYWSCWKSEVELRMCLGLFDFQTQDRVYPGHFPNPPANPEKDDRAWFFYLAEISLRRLNTRARNDIGQILSSSEAGDENTESRLIEVVTSFDQQAEAWRTSLPETISIDSDPQEDDILKFILRCHTVDFNELIFWPFVSSAANSKETLTEDMSRYARRGFATCADRIRTAGLGYLYRHHGTWMLLQSCVRSTVVLLAAAYSEHAQDLLPDNWRESVEACICMLKDWKDEDAGISDQLKVLEQLYEKLKDKSRR
ncbi:clr-1 protein [Trichoderma arundinaceum]|uniref:Clr-1 protein n=1 Tax=Trichoderma arundinaceum TaxID=490622 RepID=A0A395NZ51_TRIAR|nr:clr-1 protein [Trichoderma arundinaceum]